MLLNTAQQIQVYRLSTYIHVQFVEDRPHLQLSPCHMFIHLVFVSYIIIYLLFYIVGLCAKSAGAD